jgi:hypothetical protein
VASEDTLPELLRRLGLALADFVMLLERVRESAIWKGVLMSVTLPVGVSFIVVEHGLGRAHRGAFVVSSDVAWPVVALAATDAITLTLHAPGGPSADMHLSVWVF